MSPYVCISLPYFLGKALESTSELQAIRDSQVIAQLGAQWVEVQPTFTSDEYPVVSANRALAAAIQSHSDRIPLIFAPDCVSALGIMKGLESRQPAVLWFDAHGDFNTPETTPSGFLGGMPLAALVGRGNEALIQAIGLAPISESRVTITDARNLDPEEGRALRSSQVSFLPRLSDVHQTDWSGASLYIHLDTDVLDPSEMPTLHYPEPNGPSLDDLIGVLKHVRANTSITGVYFSLWDDSLPGAPQAKEATLRLIQTLVSKDQ